MYCHWWRLGDCIWFSFVLNRICLSLFIYLATDHSDLWTWRTWGLLQSLKHNSSIDFINLLLLLLLLRSGNYLGHSSRLLLLKIWYYSSHHQNYLKYCFCFYFHFKWPMELIDKFSILFSRRKKKMFGISIFFRWKSCEKKTIPNEEDANKRNKKKINSK